MARLMVKMAALSAVLSSVVAAGCACEQKVTLAEVPQAVKTTLDRETKGGTVTESEKEVRDGKTIYSFDAKLDGKEWDITIAEDGKLISKELEK